MDFGVDGDLKRGYQCLTALIPLERVFSIQSFPVTPLRSPRLPRSPPVEYRKKDLVNGGGACHGRKGDCLKKGKLVCFYVVTPKFFVRDLRVIWFFKRVVSVITGEFYRIGICESVCNEMVSNGGRAFKNFYVASCS